MPEKIASMDEIDYEILTALERNGRATYIDIGRRISLSPNAVADRVRRLERAGVIRGFGAHIAAEAFGLDFHAMLDVKLNPQRAADEFERDIAKMRGVIGYALTTGRFDYTLRVACSDPEDLVRLVEHLRTRSGVAETYSRIVLRDRSFPLTVTARGRHAPLRTP